MIAHRLRPIGWVAAVAVAALVFYLVSLRVAAERGALESVDRQIVYAQRDIRRLQTELGARASLRQLERWNGEVLALSAPAVGQYLESEVQLASYDGRSMTPATPAIQYAVVIEAPERSDAAKATVMRASVSTEAADPVAQPPVAKLQRVAMIDQGTMGDIVKRAAREAGTGGR